jgi:SnoaL-like domain
VAGAFNGRDWDRLRTLYHDDALLVTVIAHGKVVGPDELMDIFRGSDQTPYLIGRDQRIVAIDDDAVIVMAPLRYESGSGAIAHSRRAWLLTFKDDLVFRTHDYQGEQEARDAYAQHGIGLGV